MEYILDQLSPETISLIEASYGTISLWWDVASSWTKEQFATSSVIIEDIVW